MKTVTAYNISKHRPGVHIDLFSKVYIQYNTLLKWTCPFQKRALIGAWKGNFSHRQKLSLSRHIFSIVRIVMFFYFMSCSDFCLKCLIAQKLILKTLKDKIMKWWPLVFIRNMDSNIFCIVKCSINVLVLQK